MDTSPVPPPVPDHDPEQAKKSLAAAVKKVLKKEERKLVKMEQELNECSRAEEYKVQADLLTINIRAVTRGSSSVEVDDIYHPGQSLRIPLDPALPVPEMIKKYYKKHKKLSNRASILPQRLGQVKYRVQGINALLNELEKTDDPVDINRIKESFINSYTPDIPSRKKKDPAGHQARYRQYITSTGWTVMVGKSGTDNDTLTFRIAKPHDYWFHVMGAAGSHVVLKLKAKNKTPDLMTLKEAAGLAAHYSKLKKLNQVPVQYTQKKFVRKPRGSRPGLVTIEREKILYVRPGLLPGKMERP